MHLTPLTPAHLPSCATLTANAFLDDNLFTYLNPRRHAYPAYFRQYFLRLLRFELNQAGTALRVCVSDDADGWWDESVGEEVLGWALWEWHGEERGSREGDVWAVDGWGKRFERFAAGLEKRYTAFFNLDPSTSAENVKTYLDVMAENATDEFLNEKDGYIWLGFIATDPKFQRKGVGKKLLRWGFKLADDEGVPIGLESSPVGGLLYEKSGFEDVGTIKIAHIEDRVMVRWPNREKKGIKTDDKIEKAEP
ncbi:hypothetical protein MMC06_004680 [Schaereria dolodes]|nr:hypothetical protein [Schaereria dolodes]